MERFCLIDDCVDAVMARSLCANHYYKYRRYGTPLPELSCADCGADLSSGNLGRKRCEPCAAARLRELSQARTSRRDKTPRQCYRCGAETPPTAHAKRLCVGCSQDTDKPCAEDECGRPVRARGLCSMHYKRQMRAEGAWERAPWDDRRRYHHQKRRALKAGATSGPPFSNSDVFERDGWLCGLCEEPVPRATVWPDPLSASLDHVIPLSLGGPHSLENVQLAHLSCNVRKGARVEESALSV